MQTHKRTSFKLGLIVNPLAGLGGPAGLKGSDHQDTVELASQRGVSSKVDQRVCAVLEGLADIQSKSDLEAIHILTASGDMGGDICEAFAQCFEIETIYQSPENSSCEDTFLAAQNIKQANVDLLIFVGGDGTARDVYRAVGETQTVLGLPAGVKMHSGVFAVTPKAVVSIIDSMLNHRLVAASMAEVRDIDEDEFAQGRVRTKHYGEMLIPDDQLLVQSVKCSGLLDDELVLEELCTFISEDIQDDVLYILGSGGTLKTLKSMIGIEAPTLLGVDVWFNGKLLALDVYEAQLFELIQTYSQVKIILSIIGGQGIVLGRGNQQISPRIIELVGTANLLFISTQNKILALEGRPLRVDSGSDKLDRELSGFHKIICGYEDALLYEIRYLD